MNPRALERDRRSERRVAVEAGPEDSRIMIGRATPGCSAGRRTSLSRHALGRCSDRSQPPWSTRCSTSVIARVPAPVSRPASSQIDHGDASRLGSAWASAAPGPIPRRIRGRRNAGTASSGRRAEASGWRSPSSCCERAMGRCRSAVPVDRADIGSARLHRAWRSTTGNPGSC